MSKTYAVNCGEAVGAGHENKDIKLPGMITDGPAILAEKLAEAGWDVKGTTATKKDGEVTSTVDLESMKLNIEIKKKKEIIGRGYSAGDNQREGEKNARIDAQKQREALQQEAEEAILKVEPGINAEVRKAVQETIVESLKRKAARMGTIESIHEGVDSQGRAATTIKVRV